VSSPEPVTAASPQATAPGDTPGCFHCGLPLPAGLDLQVVIDGRRQPMCCYGCQAVAWAIVDSGNAAFYRQRTAMPPTGRELVPDFIEQTRLYDHPRVQQHFVHAVGGSIREAALMLEGITCAACIWLNERHLGQLPGVLEVSVNYATQRARIRWDAARIQLSEILQAVRAIGYAAHPYDPRRQQLAFERERRQHLRRLGVAGVLGMQVMVLSVTLYSGAWSGMEAAFTRFFYWLGLGLTTPVVLYSGLPFFRGAWRDVRNRRIGMDVPVALGILVAFTGSLAATWSGRGHVYYDSVVMFIFFLLVSRYFEIMARKKGAETAERLGQSLPAMATRLDAGQGVEHPVVVPVVDIQPGDRLLVKPGESIPADGHVETGRSSVSEAIITGESRPVAKDAGAGLIGGSINVESPLRMIVDRVGTDTVLAEIIRLLEQAQSARPALTRLADRVASWFVGAVIIAAVAVGLYWWQQAPDAWLPIVISVLVVTCPCALSLAMPTAINAATGALMANGLLTVNGRALEKLARSTHVVFDKTGTLTSGQPAVIAVHRHSGLGERDLLAIAAALEGPSEHPVGRAIRAAAGGQGAVTVSGLINTPGAGLSGRINGTPWFIGTPDFINQHCAEAASPLLLAAPDEQHCTRVLLADRQRIHALFVLRDEIRPDAASVVTALKRAGKQVLLLSGDNPAVAHQVAAEVGIDQVFAGMRPADKLERVQALQAQGAIVAMVGDGINDAPVLAAADVSIAMQSAAQLTQASADMILLSDRIGALARGVGIATRALHIIRQNLAWAVGYNLVALPAAALGHVAPWMAALGMSSSSLLVVLNALRLMHGEPVRRDQAAEQRPAQPE